MNDLYVEIPVSQDSDSRLWPCCQSCQRRKDCPYVYNQYLLYAARQGHAAASALAAEADRLMDTVSHANDVSLLLNGDRALMCALSHALRSEMALIDHLCAQTGKHCR